jgi:hypothetical protein
MNMSSFRIPRQAVSITVAISCLSCAVVANAASTYYYASTSGFSSLTTNNPVQFALSDDVGQFNTLTIRRLTDLSANMSQSTPDLTFSATAPENPDWVAGSRSFFQVAMNTTNSSPGEASYELSFATPLATSSYLVFVDFDVQESVSIKAYDASDSLIPYANISFSRQNGQSSSGATVPSSFDELAGYTGRLSTSNDSSRSDPVISLSSSVPIKRLVYDWDLNPSDRLNQNNSARFNVAVVPEPTTCVMAFLGLYSLVLRRKRA